jgi:hypothetical protein
VHRSLHTKSFDVVVVDMSASLCITLRVPDVVKVGIVINKKTRLQYKQHFSCDVSMFMGIHML